MEHKKLVISVFNLSNLVIFSVLEKPDDFPDHSYGFIKNDLLEAYRYICCANERTMKDNYMYCIKASNSQKAAEKVKALNVVTKIINAELGRTE